MPDNTSATDGADLIESDDLATLRLEILRLREQSLGEVGRAEVSADRINELEDHEVALVAEIDRLRAEVEMLQTELARTPLSRISRALRRGGNEGA